MKRLLSAISIALFLLPLSAQTPYPQITNIPGRNATCLDGNWKYIVDVYNTGAMDYRANPIPDRSSFFADRSFYSNQKVLVEYDFDYAKEIAVPGDWNTQRPELYYYEGAVWYRTKFDAEPKQGSRYFLYFGAANYETVVGLNGRRLGSHEGGFTPFNFEVTDRLKEGDNSLVVNVDNTRRMDGVPTVNSDWWNYGGITRSVYLVETPETFIREYSVQLKKGSQGVIEGWVRLDGPDAAASVNVSIPELKVSKTVTADASGLARFEIDAKPVLWCPENPKLYEVTLSSGADKVSDRIGFRTIETRGDKILLNGKEIFCKGISIHEEMIGGAGGRANSMEHARALLAEVKAMNCNFVRLAHYPQDDALLEMCDREGLLVWEEIPVVDMVPEGETFAQNCETQLREMIRQHKSHTSVILWGYMNEILLQTQRRFKGAQLDSTIQRTLDLAHRLERIVHEEDPTRTSVMAFHGSNDYNKLGLSEIPQVVGWNLYQGWYGSDMTDFERYLEQQHREQPAHPIIVSEYGAGSDLRLHNPNNSAAFDFSMDYQQRYAEHYLPVIENTPYVCGAAYWNFID